jgi:hypothetical protein
MEVAISLLTVNVIKVFRFFAFVFFFPHFCFHFSLRVLQNATDFESFVGMALLFSFVLLFYSITGFVDLALKFSVFIMTTHNLLGRK